VGCLKGGNVSNLACSTLVEICGIGIFPPFADRFQKEAVARTNKLSEVCRTPKLIRGSLAAAPCPCTCMLAIAVVNLRLLRRSLLLVAAVLSTLKQQEIEHHQCVVHEGKVSQYTSHN
jgi:hypothetical protein